MLGDQQRLGRVERSPEQLELDRAAGRFLGVPLEVAPRSRRSADELEVEEPALVQLVLAVRPHVERRRAEKARLAELGPAGLLDRFAQHRVRGRLARIDRTGGHLNAGFGHVHVAEHEQVSSARDVSKRLADLPSHHPLSRCMNHHWWPSKSSAR